MKVNIFKYNNAHQEEPQLLMELELNHIPSKGDMFLYNNIERKVKKVVYCMDYIDIYIIIVEDFEITSTFH